MTLLLCRSTKCCVIPARSAWVPARFRPATLPGDPRRSSCAPRRSVMRSTPVTRRAGGMVLALLLLLGAGLCGELAPLVARAEATTSPIPAESEEGSLAAMLGRLPDRPLGLDGAMVTYADVASQTAALGIDAPRRAGDEVGGQRWIA